MISQTIEIKHQLLTVSDNTRDFLLEEEKEKIERNKINAMKFMCTFKIFLYTSFLIQVVN